MRSVLLTQLAGAIIPLFFWILTSTVFAETVNHRYDDAGRLIRSEYGDGATIHHALEYTYDEVGNRTRESAESPVISASPASYDFGTLTGGVQSKTATVYVSNAGKVDLNISDVRISGNNADQFALQTDDCTGRKLPYSNTCGITVAFKPSAAGAKHAALTITSSDPDRPATAIPLAGTGIDYALTVNKAGITSGIITSVPTGINCGSDCSKRFMDGTAVTLAASTSTDTVFIGWSGGGCTGTGTCTVAMLADTAITASFCAAPVRIAGSAPQYFLSLQAAYNAASNGSVIQSRNVTLAENLNINRAVSVTLDGGYSCDYSAKTGKTTIQGRMDITGGTASVGDYNLQ